MADFVERAVLRLEDQSSAAAKTINSSLNRLYATAKKLEGLSGKKLNLGGNARQINATVNQLNKLAAAANSVPQIVLRVNSSQVQRAITRLATLQSMTGTQLVPVSVGAQGGGRGRGGGGGSVHIAPSSWTPMRDILAHWSADIGRRVAHAVVSATREGLRTEDIAATRVRMQQLSAEDQKTFNRSVQTIFERQRETQTGTVLSQGQVATIAAEALPIVRGDLKAMAVAIDRLIPVINTQVAVGEELKKSTDNAFQLLKAAEQTGNLTTPEGQFDQRRLDAFLKTYAQTQAIVGREQTAQAFLQLAKYLQQSKLSLSLQGLQTAAFLFEEQGTQAAVGINQLIRQLSGQRLTKQALARQEELGLGTVKEVTIGSVGGKQIKQRVGAGSANDQLLFQDPAEYVRRYVIPAMRKAGFDPNNPVDASKFAGQITSDRTAIATLTSLIIRSEELFLQRQQAQRLNKEQEKVDRENAQSLTVKFAAVQAQFEGLLGGMANSMNNILNPALGGIANIIGRISSFVSGGSEGDGTSSLRAGVVATGGAAAAGGALLGGRALLNLFNPLNGSAVALNTSAANLNFAAAALTRAAGGKVAGNIATGAGGAAAGAATGGAAGLAAKLLRGAGMFAIATTAATLAIDYFNDGPIKKAVQGASERITATKTAKPGEGGASVSELAALKTSLDKINAEIARQRAQEKIPGTSDIAVQGLQNQANLISEQINILTAENAAKFDATFNNGSTKLKEVGPVLDAAATAFGPIAGAGIKAVASEFGAIAGAAIAAAANNLSINLKTPAATPNVGTRTPE